MKDKTVRTVFDPADHLLVREAAARTGQPMATFAARAVLAEAHRVLSLPRPDAPRAPQAESRDSTANATERVKETPW